jgi:hypothetical protein
VATTITAAGKKMMKIIVEIPDPVSEEEKDYPPLIYARPQRASPSRTTRLL